MRKSESASGLQMGSFMKAMRVMILAVVALTGCGPQGEDEGAATDMATTQSAVTQACDDVNCQQARTLIGPSGTNALPQDPVPLHPDGPPHGAAADGDVTRVR